MFALFLLFWGLQFTTILGLVAVSNIVVVGFVHFPKLLAISNTTLHLMVHTDWNKLHITDR